MPAETRVGINHIAKHILAVRREHIQGDEKDSTLANKSYALPVRVLDVPSFTVKSDDTVASHHVFD